MCILVVREECLFSDKFIWGQVFVNKDSRIATQPNNTKCEHTSIITIFHSWKLHTQIII